MPNFLINIFQKVLKWPFLAFSFFRPRSRKFGQNKIFIWICESSENQFCRSKKKKRSVNFEIFWKSDALSRENLSSTHDILEKWSSYTPNKFWTPFQQFLIITPIDKFLTFWYCYWFLVKKLSSERELKHYFLWEWMLLADLIESLRRTNKNGHKTKACVIYFKNSTIPKNRIFEYANYFGLFWRSYFISFERYWCFGLKPEKNTMGVWKKVGFKDCHFGHHFGHFGHLAY